MSLKRKYGLDGGQGYVDHALEDLASWQQDFTQDDYHFTEQVEQMTGDAALTSEPGMADLHGGGRLPGYGPRRGHSEGPAGRAESRISDKLHKMSRAASVDTTYGYDHSGDPYGYEQEADAYAYDQSFSQYGYGDDTDTGYGESQGYGDWLGYGEEQGYNDAESQHSMSTQEMWYRCFSTQRQQSRNSVQSSQRGGSVGGSAARGRGRGQGQSQVAGRGQRGQRGLSLRGWGQVQDQRGGRGLRGKRGSQSFNQQTTDDSGMSFGAPPAKRARGRGQRGGFGQYARGSNSGAYTGEQQHSQQGSTGGQQFQRGRARGRGSAQRRGLRGQHQGQTNDRGAFSLRGQGRGSTAKNVSAVANNIMGMVLGQSKKKGVGRGGGAGRRKGWAGVGAAKPSSLMDLVNNAWHRKFGQQSKALSGDQKTVRIGQFLDFFKTFPDRVNGIQTICNAVTSSKLNLTDEFEADLLMTLIKPLFTGTLSIGGVFLTRGLGLSKKAVKHDCYERAVQMLRSKSLEEIMALEDCGKEALREEVVQQSEEDFDAFKAFLFQKQAIESDTSDKIRTAAIAESQVPERNFPLADKMMMLLKELEKPGMDDVPLTSRADVLCFKVGITVAALFKALNPEDAAQAKHQMGKADSDIELVCEIYFDSILVGQGSGCPRKKAQMAAYENIFARVKKEPVARIAEGSKLHACPEVLPGFVEIQHKGSKQQSGNNHHRLGTLKLFPPDLTLNPDDIVIIESEGDNVEENAYKILESSASKSGMLLEWRQLDKVNTNSSFRCEMTLQQQKSVIGIAPSKAKARSTAAALLLMELYQTQDIIKSTSREDIPPTTSFADIRAQAEALRSQGPACPDRLTFDPRWPQDESKEAEDENDLAADIQQWILDPMRPWIEDAIVEMLENYAKKLTLEDLVFSADFPLTARKFITHAAHTHLLAVAQRHLAPDGMCLVIHKRCITPQDMVKILHVNKLLSGRYQLVRANRPFPVVKQVEFVRNFPDVWRAKLKAVISAERQKREAEEAEKK